MNFISGEKFQYNCDLYIGFKDLTINPNINTEKILYINTIIKSFNNPYKIYTYTHILKEKYQNGVYKLVEKLLFFRNPFILIFHNSDVNFNKEYLCLFDKLPLLQHIYTQNMNVIHNKVSYLPIGFANSMWKHGNYDIYNEIYNMNIEKIKNIYFNFRIETNLKERQKCFNSIKEKNIIFNKSLSYRDYLIELKQHKYAICPEGNGIDTHRFWECLYMNTIPICKKNILINAYQQYYPIIILDNWSDLNIELLENKYSTLKINHNYLDINYYLNKINYSNKSNIL